jgi:hypothetical protein
LTNLLSDNSLPESWSLSPGTPDNDLFSNITPATYQDVRIFPNPASEYIRIAFSQVISGKADIEIYDLYGSMRMRVTSQNRTGGEILLGVHSLANGTYIVKVTTENTVIKQPVIIIH